ncbi:MAG: tetraacyldisaccharide 4'-kinase [Deltaproteobacteria bacterium]|nr:tetraacyldisaccharide 4'-kinase [Deltaproteobacteria bacterium]
MHGISIGMMMGRLREKAVSVLRSEGNEPRLFPLAVFSIIYRGIVGVRNLLYDSGVIPAARLGCKVISVGNITVGGTGKTPTVIALAAMLKRNGYRPAVLSRGYKGKSRRPVNIVSDGKGVIMSAREAGDEPVLIAQSVASVPVLTGKRRSITGRYAVEHFGANVLILDDAFQHRSVSRDIDIVLLDGRRPLGNGWVLPRGGLREPPQALRRAHIVLVNGPENEGSPCAMEGLNDWLDSRDLSSLAGRPVFMACRTPRDLRQGGTGAEYPLDHMKGKKIVAFAGIADPGDFRRTVASIGGQVESFIPFADHHSYRRDDIEAIRHAAGRVSADIIVTTEKDGIKLADFPEFLHDVFMLRIDMEIFPSAGEHFESLVRKLLET